MDAGYCSYHSLLSMKHRHTNPIWGAFNWCNNKAWEDGLDTGTMKSQKLPRTWIRWHVAVTLARNPQCIALRRGGHQTLCITGDQTQHDSDVALEQPFSSDGTTEKELCPIVPDEMIHDPKVRPTMAYSPNSPNYGASVLLRLQTKKEVCPTVPDEMEHDPKVHPTMASSPNFCTL